MPAYSSDAAAASPLGIEQVILPGKPALRNIHPRRRHPSDRPRNLDAIATLWERVQSRNAITAAVSAIDGKIPRQTQRRNPDRASQTCLAARLGKQINAAPGHKQCSSPNLGIIPIPSASPSVPGSALRLSKVRQLMPSGGSRPTRSGFPAPSRAEILRFQEF